MGNEEILSRWKNIYAIIADEITSNADFAQKIGSVLCGNEAITKPNRRNRRPPAKIDPYALLEQGEDKLSNALAELSIDELKDVISANGMDSAKLAMKWKNRERLMNHITEATKRKSSRGEAFWNSSERTGNN
jgi:hypothetical protein